MSSLVGKSLTQGHHRGQCLRVTSSLTPRARLLSDIIAFALPIGATAFSALHVNRPFPSKTGACTNRAVSNHRTPLFCQAVADTSRVQSTFTSCFPSNRVIVPELGMDRSLALLDRQLSELNLQQQWAHSSNRTLALIHAVALQLQQLGSEKDLEATIAEIDWHVTEYLQENKDMKSVSVPDHDIGREIVAITDWLSCSVRVLHVALRGLTETLYFPQSDVASKYTVTVVSVAPFLWSTAPASWTGGGSVPSDSSQLIGELSERLIRAKALSTAFGWVSSERKATRRQLGGDSTVDGMDARHALQANGQLPSTAQMLDLFTSPGRAPDTHWEELSQDLAADTTETAGTGAVDSATVDAEVAEVAGAELEAAGVEREVQRKRGPAAKAATSGGVEEEGEAEEEDGGDKDGSVEAGEHFVLVDVSGYIYRAYHKVPAMTNEAGVNVNSVRSFCLNLIRLLFQTFPDANLVAVFDHPGGSFRSELAPSYKANRPPPPEDLIPQFGLVRAAAEALAVPCVEVEGFEADDVIASIAQRVAEAGGQVTMISSDKDLYQLLSPRVDMYSPLDKKYVLPEKVQSKFGVGPAQVAHVQALAGDSTDNVPGVPGIGVKTAAKLIAEHGTVEALLAAASTIKQKRPRESLLAHAEAARVSLQLVTLRTDVPLPELQTLRRRPADHATLKAFLDTNGISVPIPPQLGKAPTKSVKAARQDGPDATAPAAFSDAAPEAEGEQQYELISRLEEVDKLVQEAMSEGVVALEALATPGGGQAAELTGLGVAVRAGKAAYIPLRHLAAEGEEGQLAPGCLDVKEVLPRMRAMLEDDGVLKVGHNLKLLVALLGRELEGLQFGPFDDTMLLSFVLDAGRGFEHTLPEMAQQYLHKERPALDEMVQEGQKKTRGKLKAQLLPPLGARDHGAGGAALVLQLHAALRPRLVTAGLVSVYERIERPLMPVLARMEAKGVVVDILRLRGLSESYSEQVAELEQDIFRLAGTEFSVASPKQLAEVLFEQMGLPAKKRGKKSELWSTDAGVMDELAKEGYEIARKVTEWRSASKLRSTYADPLVKQVNPRTDRLHTSFCMATAVTGRLSSVDPNLQNIPNMGVGKDIRKAFVADDGYKVLSADYSQIELRLLAHIADIQPLIHAFHNNIDIHKLTASQVFGVSVEEVTAVQRKGAKAINFGIIYGQSAFGLAKQLDISQQEAQQYIDAYFKQYPGIGAYMERARGSARQHGYVETLFGRRCHIPNMRGTGSSAAYAGRKAINAPIQGTAADVIKVAMVRMEEALECAGLHARMLLQVHDELVFEVLEGEEEESTAVIKDVMEQACLPAHPLKVPLIVEVGIGESWEDAH